MKTILAILADVFVAVLFLGYLFVQLTNQPEQVAALQKKTGNGSSSKN